MASVLLSTLLLYGSGILVVLLLLGIRAREVVREIARLEGLLTFAAAGSGGSYLATYTQLLLVWLDLKVMVGSLMNLLLTLGRLNLPTI